METLVIEKISVQPMNEEELEANIADTLVKIRESKQKISELEREQAELARLRIRLKALAVGYFSK
jgi:hypothetical protein